MASSNYWKKREEEWRKKCEEEERDWQAQISDVYQNLIYEIQDQIDIFYQKYAEANELSYADAQRYLSQTDMKYYAELAKKYCRQAQLDMRSGTYAQDESKEYFSKEANAEMKRYNTTMKISRLQMLQSQLRLRMLYAGAKTDEIIGMALKDRTYKMFQEQAGILGETVLNNLKHVDQIVKASFHGATFSDRIWGPHQDRLQKKLNKALVNCMVLGKGSAPFTRELAKETGVSKRQAQRLMNTELARVQIQAHAESLKEMGFEEFQILSNPDCCEECQALNGLHYKLEDMSIGENTPPMHPGCRCDIGAYIPEDDDDGFDEAAFDEWSETYEEHGLRWEEWKKKSVMEEEDSTRRINAKTTIDRKFISSKEYRTKFEQIDDDPKISRALASEARTLLNLFQGTEQEGMAFIDSRTGKMIVNHTERSKKSVTATANMRKLVEKNPHQVIGVHNHPGSSSPSAADILGMAKRKYKYGIVCCHDGTVYKYSAIDEGEILRHSSYEIDSILAQFDSLADSCFHDQYEVEKQRILDKLLMMGIRLEMF